MISPCSQKIYYLRRKNRDLLDQLESNSALLERRLKKLKHTASTASTSPVKKKFHSWKTRNCSKQMSSVLNRKVCNCDQYDPDDASEEPLVISPAKRTRHSVLVESNSRNKECKPHSSFCKSTKAVDGTKRKEKNNRGYSCTDKLHRVLDSSEDASSPSSPICACNLCEDFAAKKRKDKSCFERVKHKRTLEAAKSIISYSPQSIFLRRLKQRSQAIGDLLHPDNVRHPQSNKRNSFYHPDQENQLDSSHVRTSPAKHIRSVNCHRLKECSNCPSQKPSLHHHIQSNETKNVLSTKTRPMQEKRSPRNENSHYSPVEGRTKACRYRGLEADRSPRRSPVDNRTTRTPSQSPVSVDKAKKGSKDSSHHSPSPKKGRPKKTRKRVCYRKNCYCRIQPKQKSKPRPVSSTKENLNQEDSLIKELSSPGDSTASPEGCQGCCGKKLSREVSGLMSNTLTSLVENEQVEKCVCCGCYKNPRWFDELNEFRQSHYFDCHANPSTVDVDPNRTHEGQPAGHKCIHKYTVDDRFFVRPLNPDLHDSSRCWTCNLPEKSCRREAPLPITLPSSLHDPNIQVSVPLPKRKPKSHKSSANSLSHMKSCHGVGTRTIGNLKSWIPPPVDSFALRYQKGICK